MTDHVVRAAMPTGNGVRLAEESVPAGVVDQGEVVDVEALAIVIRQLWANAKFPTRQVVIGLGNRDVVTRPLDIPDMSDRDLRSALTFELADMIPFPTSEAVLEMARIETVVDEREVNRAHVLAIAVHRNSVTPLVEAVRAAKLSPVRAELVSFGLVRSASIAGPDLAGTRALVHLEDSSLTVVVHDEGIIRFTRRVAVAGGDAADAADLEADLQFVERYQRRDQATAGGATVTLERADPLVAAITGTIEYYSIQTAAVPLSGVDLIGDLDRAAVMVPALQAAIGELIDVRTVDEFADEEPDELAEAARGPFAAVLGLTLEPGGRVRGPAAHNLLPPAPAVPLRKVAVRGAFVAAAALLAGLVVTSVAGPDASSALDEADSAEAATSALQARLSALGDERVDAVALRQGEQRISRLLEDRVPWEILIARIRASTPPGTTLLSVTARAAVSTPTGRVPGQIELTAQAASQAAASTWLTVLGDIEGVRRPWLSAAATADEDGVGGVSTFTITVELADDFSELLASTPGAGSDDPLASTQEAP